MPLNQLKKCLPLKKTKFAVARRIYDDPEFKWWVPCTLRHRDIIIAGANKKISIVTNKHGVEMPNLVGYAKKLDNVNGKKTMDGNE